MHCATHGFAPLRVDVHEGVEGEKGGSVEVWGTFRGNEWGNKGEVVPVRMDESGVWGVEVGVQGGKEYFMERGGCESLFFFIHIRGLGIFANRVVGNSFAAESAEESYDSYCGRKYASCVWDALSHGQQYVSPPPIPIHFLRTNGCMGLIS